MTEADLKRHIWRNTLSNYGCVVVRLVMGVVMFRLLIQFLPQEEFAFWGTLWSLFGYSILLDFGFGFTAQKRVAELAVREDWEELSRILSTIFYTYVGIGLLIVLVGAAGSHLWIQIFNITEHNREPFRQLLVIFLCGLGLAFPLGLFPEILRGLQRISLANLVLLAGMVVNFGLAGAALYLGWGLRPLLAIALACTFVPDLICAFFTKKALPRVRIHPRYFSPGMIGKTMSFSLFAYVITLSNIILTKTDNLVLCVTLSVSSVAFYLPGAKMGEMFYSLTQQLPDTLSPAAAHLNAKGRHGVLQELLVNSTRLNLMLATPLYCICALLLRGILGVVIGHGRVSADDPEVYWTAQVLLAWMYTMVVTQSVPKRIFMMTGHERRLMWLGVAEAIMNLALSVALVLTFRKVWCVALGSLIATFFFGWFYLWPWSAREAELSGWSLARAVLLPTWFACFPLLTLAFLIRIVPGLRWPAGLPFFIVEGGVALLVAGLGVWRLGLDGGERSKVAAQAMKLFSRRKAA